MHTPIYTSRYFSSPHPLTSVSIAFYNRSHSKRGNSMSRASLAPDRVDYLPIIDRPIIKWPNGARVAFWVAPNIEHYEYLPPLDGVRNPWPRTPLPDAQQYSMHEYGNRVGFWRLLPVLDHYGIRCSTTLNIGVLERFPDI